MTALVIRLLSPAWWQDAVCYDHVYVSREFEIDQCRCIYLEEILEKKLSDHAPVLATLSLS
jgi:endonuclease/exonuclease/phosphatase family metal-dependent hydrolase